MSFLQSTYAAAAKIGNWDRAALECELGKPGAPPALYAGVGRNAFSCTQSAHVSLTWVSKNSENVATRSGS
nr:hypothetical protein [Roseovarius sp. Pro17]